MESNKTYIHQKAEFNHRKIFHYLIPSEIGNIHVVQYEMPDKELKDKYIGFDIEEAEKRFKRICTQILNNKI